MPETTCGYRIPAWDIVSAVFGFLVFLCPPSTWSAQADPWEPHATSEVVAIPFHLYKGKLIVVKASIGAIRDINMVLDTGTRPSSISKSLANKLALPRRVESLLTLNRPIQVQSLILPAIQLGMLHATSIRVLVQDFGDMEAHLGMAIGGIIGADILSTTPFTIDYASKRIVFRYLTLRNVISSVSSRPFLIVVAKVNGQPVRLLVDSGVSELLVFRGRLRIASDEVRIDDAAVLTPGGSTQLTWFLAHVSLATNYLGEHRVEIADLDRDLNFDGLLGLAGMGFHRVSFDVEQQLFSWE